MDALAAHATLPWMTRSSHRRRVAHAISVGAQSVGTLLPPSAAAALPVHVARAQQMVYRLCCQKPLQQPRLLHLFPPQTPQRTTLAVRTCPRRLCLPRRHRCWALALRTHRSPTNSCLCIPLLHAAAGDLAEDAVAQWRNEPCAQGWWEDVGHALVVAEPIAPDGWLLLWRQRLSSRPTFLACCAASTVRGCQQARGSTWDGRFRAGDAYLPALAQQRLLWRPAPCRCPKQAR